MQHVTNGNSKKLVLAVLLGFQWINLIGAIVALLRMFFSDATYSQIAFYLACLLTIAVTIVLAKNTIYVLKKSTYHLPPSKTKVGEILNCIAMSLPSVGFADLLITLEMQEEVISTVRICLLVFVSLIAILAAVGMTLYCILDDQGNQEKDSVKD